MENIYYLQDATSLPRTSLIPHSQCDRSSGLASAVVEISEFSTLQTEFHHFYLLRQRHVLNVSMLSRRYYTILTLLQSAMHKITRIASATDIAASIQIL
jgi:hypothetical protein